MPRRTARLVPRHHRQRRLQARVPRAAQRLRRPPHAALLRPAHEREVRLPPLPEARGPKPHGGAQDKQRHRPGPHSPAHGQAPRNSRDGRRPARSGRGDGVRPAGHGLQDIHGQGRRGAPARQRRAHAHARGRGGGRGRGQHDAEPRLHGGYKILVRQPGRHVLRRRLGRRAPPCSTTPTTSACA